MNKEEIQEYLEKNLKTHPDDVFDNNDRLVLLSDVVIVVDKLINGDKPVVYPPGYYQFK